MNDGSDTTNGMRRGLTEPAHHGDERTALLGYLQRQRDLVIWKVSNGQDEALRRIATSTGLTVHGVVRHLTNVEKSWLRDHFAGQPDLVYDWTDEDPDGELHVPADVPITHLTREYAAEAVRCDEVVAAASLDDTSVDGRYSLRWILLHLIEETGRHLGHLDLLREQADGRTGEEPATP